MTGVYKNTATSIYVLGHKGYKCTLNRVEQFEVPVKKQFKTQLLELILNTVKLKCVEVIRVQKTIFKLLKNDPGYKYHDFWSQFSTLKKYSGSIYGEGRISSCQTFIIFT